jgi:hypothetical protein
VIFRDGTRLAWDSGIESRLAIARHRREEVRVQLKDASNERFDGLSRLRLHDKQVSGDPYARWGASSMGVELENGERRVHLVGARKRYAAQPGLAAR